MTPAGRARVRAGIGLAGLAALALAYVLTSAPAPSIRVRWREDVGPARQAALERTYRLSNGRAPKDRSVAYDLLDTRRSNIRALVLDPGVADTNDLDRSEYVVRPDAAAGERRTWIAHRTPGLREPWILWTFVAVLAVLAVLGLRGSHVPWHRILLFDGRDVFDRLPSPPATMGAASVLSRFATAALLLLAIGVPILETWDALFLAAGALAIVFGVPRAGWRRIATAAAVTLAVTGIKTMLPRADIAEAHNAFLVLHDGEPLEQGLPAVVFQSWKAQFEALYPAGAATGGPFQWRTSGVPKAVFTRSSDAIWRTPKYTRQVDRIRFHTLGEFRGGFANESQYNFWAGDLDRESMPFYVMYELTPASVGSRLAWKGQAFWERPDGGFDEVLHEQVESRTIVAGDAGRRVYAAFFPKRDPELSFTMELSPRLRLAAAARAILTLAGGVAVLMLTVRPRWGAFARALVLFAGAYVVIVSYLPIRPEYLGPTYPPHSGGDDGLAHEGWGREMAMLARDGHLLQAFEGREPVYWFTPGTRYFRMAEKLIVGDTNLLYMLLVACMPMAVFYVLWHLAGIGWAWAITVVFCLMPVGNLSFLQYIANAKGGYGEAMGGGLFLFGLALLLRTQPGWGSADDAPPLQVWLAGAALAASMFVRPNFAIAVAWVGAAHAWASWRRRAMRPLVALALGLGLALWMPLHNWYYGGELHLISKSGATISVPLGAGDYASALGDLLRGRVETRAVAVTSAQVRGWLMGPGFLGSNAVGLARAAHGAKLIALLVTCWVALGWLIRRGAVRPDLGVVAVAALCAHLPMLFIFTTYYRYAMLGWDLSLIVLLAWLARQPVWRLVSHGADAPGASPLTA